MVTVRYGCGHDGETAERFAQFAAESICLACKLENAGGEDDIFEFDSSDDDRQLPASVLAERTHAAEAARPEIDARNAERRAWATNEAWDNS